MSASLKSSLGSTVLGGADPLLGRDALAGLTSSGAAVRRPAYRRSRLRVSDSKRAAYRRTLGQGSEMRENGQDYRVGYRISHARHSGSDMQFGIEGTQRENRNNNAESEHTLALPACAELVAAFRVLLASKQAMKGCQAQDS